MAKIYLSARYSRHEEMRACRDVLRALGHEVTSHWLDGVIGSRQSAISPEKLNKTYKTDFESSSIDRIVKDDLADIREADWIICFNIDWYTSIDGLGPPKGEDDRDGLTSRHVELGYALALGKRVIVCGKLEHQYHAAEGVEVWPTWQELLVGLIQKSRDTESEVGS